MFCFNSRAINTPHDQSIIKQLFGLDVRHHVPCFRILGPGFPHSIDLIPWTPVSQKKNIGAT